MQGRTLHTLTGQQPRRCGAPMCQASLAIDLPWLREFGARNTDEDGQATRLTGPIATPVPAGLLRCTPSFPLNEGSYEIAYLTVS